MGVFLLRFENVPVLTHSAFIGMHEVSAVFAGWLQQDMAH